MATKSNRLIEIVPQSKHHQLFLLTLGAILLVLCFTVNVFYWHAYKVQLMLLMFASFVVFLLGLLKLCSPNVSYQITPKKVKFIHPSGQWQLLWQDIVRIGSVNAHIQGQHYQLPYLGIKLNTLANIADHISPRLANKLLHEQQELMLLAIKSNDISAQAGLINFDIFTIKDKSYKGPIAAWLHRSEQLAQAYGYHLFLAQDSLDRDINQFIELLKQCKNHSIKIIPSEN